LPVIDKNPARVNVVTPAGSETVENVETWWYDGLDLVVLLTTGESTRYPQGNILE